MTGAYAPFMDSERPTSNTTAADASRLQWEAGQIAKGEAEIEAGLCHEWHELEARYDALDLDPNAPMPHPLALR